jgi:hypothetical protein
MDEQDREKSAKCGLGKCVETGDYAGSRDEGAADAQTESDQTQNDHPFCRGGISFVDPGPVKQSSRGQPWHKRNVLRNIPEPMALRTKLLVSQPRT